MASDVSGEADWQLLIDLRPTEYQRRLPTILRFLLLQHVVIMEERVGRWKWKTKVRHYYRDTSTVIGAATAGDFGIGRPCWKALRAHGQKSRLYGLVGGAVLQLYVDGGGVMDVRGCTSCRFNLPNQPNESNPTSIGFTRASTGQLETALLPNQTSFLLPSLT